MQQRIIYIINPISGTRTKKDLQQFIQETTKQKRIPFQIYPSVASGDYSFLQPIIKEERITDVVIAGGDGTVSQVVSSLMKEDVNFGIIPCGSGNGLALAAKISKQPARALDVIFNGKASAIDEVVQQNRFSRLLYDHNIEQAICKMRLGSNGKIVSKLVAVRNTNKKSLRGKFHSIAFNCEMIG